MTDDDAMEVAKTACTVFLTAAEGHHPEPCRTCERIATALTTAADKAHALGRQGRGLDGKLLPAPPFTQQDRRPPRGTDTEDNR